MKPLVLLTLGLGGCNTVEGFGKDSQDLGGSIGKKTDKSIDSNDLGACGVSHEQV
jgi:predicted small secreted protein